MKVAAWIAAAVILVVGCFGCRSGSQETIAGIVCGMSVIAVMWGYWSDSNRSKICADGIEEKCFDEYPESTVVACLVAIASGSLLAYSGSGLATTLGWLIVLAAVVFAEMLIFLAITQQMVYTRLISGESPAISGGESASVQLAAILTTCVFSIPVVALSSAATSVHWATTCWAITGMMICFAGMWLAIGSGQSAEDKALANLNYAKACALRDQQKNRSSAPCDQTVSSDKTEPPSPPAPDQEHI